MQHFLSSFSPSSTTTAQHSTPHTYMQGMTPPISPPSALPHPFTLCTRRERLLSLLYPAVSVMDLNIGAALWLATSARGRLLTATSAAAPTDTHSPSPTGCDCTGFRTSQPGEVKPGMLLPASPPPTFTDGMSLSRQPLTCTDGMDTTWFHRPPRHAPTYACPRLCMPSPMRALTYACPHLCMPSPMHALAYACPHLCVPSPMHALTYACPHLCVPSPIHALT